MPAIMQPKPILTAYEQFGTTPTKKPAWMRQGNGHRRVLPRDIDKLTLGRARPVSVSGVGVYDVGAP